MVKLKITRIINNDDGDEGEELYLTGEIVLSDGKYQMNQILNGEAKITACASDQVLEIPKLKIPSILDHKKHVITITWLESLEKAWFQFVFSDDNCVDVLKEIKKYSDLFVLMQNEFLNLKSQNKLKNIGLEELKEKKSCCCLYEQDMQLYRGVIQEVDFFTQTAKVMYIDFGNVDTVSFNHIYELDQIFKQVPMQAIEFKIRNKEEDSDKKIVDSCVEAEFYLDNHIPELKIYQIE